MLKSSIARHYPAVVGVAGVLFLGIPVLMLLHALLFILFAAAIGSFMADWALWLLQLAVRDPRHAEIATYSLREIEVMGLAVGWPFGISAVVEPDSTLVGRVAASFGALTLLLGFGRLLVHVGNQARLGRLVVCGVVTQAWAALEALDQPLTLEDLNSMGLSAVATKVLGLNAAEYQTGLTPFLVIEAAGVPVAAMSLLALMAILTYGAPWIVGRLADVPRRALAYDRLRRENQGVRAPRRPAVVPRLTQVSLLVGTGLIALAPLRAWGAGESFEPVAAAEIPELDRGAGVSPNRPALPADPSVIEIKGTYPEYQLLVNGVPFRIRGVGYNVYASQLPQVERTAHYERDFSLMRRAGFNTILGWEQSEFDEVLLDSAYAMGLRVILPFALPPQVETIDYGDPATRKALLKQVGEWVVRFKDHPAVLMYAPGNEVLTAMKTYFKQGRGQQRAYATFYRELADLIHELDPSHPVICREAEVWYIDLLQQAFAAGPPRPWFILGTNLYGTTSSFGQGLVEREELSWRLPGVITEFSPVGYRTQDRPHRVLDMVRMTESTRLLGWVLYVWTVEGPEPLDRSFGLVDGYAHPVDRTLGALRAFHEKRPIGPASRATQSFPTLAQPFSPMAIFLVSDSGSAYGVGHRRGARVAVRDAQVRDLAKP